MILLRKAIFSGDASKRQTASLTLLQPVCLSNGGSNSEAIEYLRRCLSQELAVRSSIYSEIQRQIRGERLGIETKIALLELLNGHLMLFYEQSSETTIPLRYVH